jgi:hypothetical protein
MPYSFFPNDNNIHSINLHDQLFIMKQKQAAQRLLETPELTPNNFDGSDAGSKGSSEEVAQAAKEAPYAWLTGTDPASVALQSNPAMFIRPARVDVGGRRESFIPMPSAGYVEALASRKAESHPHHSVHMATINGGKGDPENGPVDPMFPRATKLGAAIEFRQDEARREGSMSIYDRQFRDAKIAAANASKAKALKANADKKFTNPNDVSY